MILPIVVYGHPILRKKSQEITPKYPDIQEIINDMYETMYQAKGVGLAAPQIGLSICLFIIDTTEMEKEKDTEKSIKQTFINPKIIEFSGEDTVFSEGCLSVPEIHENVSRKSQITIRYQDENFVEQTKIFDGMPARVIQHEYDHLLGKTFIEYLPSLKRTLLKRKLNDISTGKNIPFYKIKLN